MSNKKEQNLHLYTFTAEELAEIYASLYLKDEVTRRLLRQPERSSTESKILKRVGRDFSERYAHHLRAEIMTILDNFLDEQIDEEVMWMQIEDELNNLNNTEENPGTGN